MTIASAGDAGTVRDAPEEHTTDRPSRRWGRLHWRAPVAVVTGTALLGLHASAYGNWLIDDAAITFAYARNIAEGLGPVVQPGADPVEGYSNPAWLLLLVVGRLLGLFDHGTLFGVPDYVLFPKVLALACCAGILALSHVAARRITSRPWLVPVVVGAVLAATPSFVIWTFSGLENGLYALLLVGQAVLLFRAVSDGRSLTTTVAITAGTLAALAALTRPEGLIYAGTYPLVLLVQLRRATVAVSLRRVAESTLAFAIPVGAYFGWRWLEFGQLLSSPSVAKGQDLPTLLDLTRPGELVNYAGAPAVLLAAGVVAVALVKAPENRPALLALLVPLGLAVIAYSVLESDWMEQYRFATPVWALGAVAVVLSAVELFRRAGIRARVWLSAALLVALLPSTAAFADAGERFRADPNISACYVADRFGRVFNGYADILGLRHGTLLLPDLGGTALTSRLTIVDMAGLADPVFAEMARNQDRAAQRDHVYGVVEPTFVHVREPWSSGTGIGWDARLERDYYPIHFDVYQGGEPHGDWVRKSAVSTPGLLAELRAYAGRTAAWVEDRAGISPLRACGPTLRRGQTELSEPPPGAPHGPVARPKPGVAAG